METVQTAMTTRISNSVLFACAMGLILSGCGGGPAPAAAAGGGISHTGPLKVTATIGMIADVAQQIAGDHAEVTGLMGPGVDPHLYKATRGDLDKLTGADLILYNGLHLEGKMADVLVQMAHKVRTIQVTDGIPQDLLREPPEFAGQFDPHVWFDVSLWARVSDRIRDALIEADPANKADYEANSAAYRKQLEELDAYAREQIATIPKEQRVLVTAHDAFGYFGRAYDIEVMGLQGISTTAEYGLQDLTRLVDVIVQRRIKAVFVESSISPKSIEALVRGVQDKGSEVKIGGQLFSDAMGQAETPEGSYLGMVRHNVDTIVGALR
ncbi:MAG: zinc ABC transporter substrate-binding protein [Candidatus Hydrogenedentes bacterium]|nr:zinc ABC transporter substrate-binding protein [Candidatus Hydrogenedentota bacterium]